MKSVCTSIEQVRLDKGHLLIDGWDDDTEKGREILRDIFGGVGDFPEAERSAADYLAPLTSPVAYMSSLPQDPFIGQHADGSKMGYGSYLDTYLYVDVDPQIDGYNMNLAGLKEPVCSQHGITPMKKGDFAICGIGPDGKFGSATGINSERGVPYDSSNGLTSVGDIFMRSGGGINK
jgi:hypothetical protein